MSNLAKHAESELELAGLFDKDSGYAGAIGEAVMELMHVFAAQGHSGGSACMVISLFSKLAAYETLTPIHGSDDEWCEVMNGMMQNKRNSAIFKDTADGKPYYIDAIVWKTPSGMTWSGCADGVRSCQYIKEFPFTPRTFYINVSETEVKKDDWEFHIINPLDLNEVWEYYNEFNFEKNGCHALKKDVI